jgi:2-C-methyl-D-erythritol 4-phosphate cytidylyltransferase
MKDLKKVAIIVAAGSGTRMSSHIPKQFHLLSGVPLAIHPGLQFRKFDPSIELIYVIAIGSAQIWENLLKTFFPEGNWRLCMGGKTRFESVQNGVKSIQHGHALVAIHDGARPFIEPIQIEQAFEMAFHKGNAVFSVPVKDSIRVKAEGDSSHFVDRSVYYYVQTPQIFWLKDLQKTYDQLYDPRFTDDATVMELAGFPIHLFEGSYNNIKVTTPEDWILAEKILDWSPEDRK